MTHFPLKIIATALVFIGHLAQCQDQEKSLVQEFPAIMELLDGEKYDKALARVLALRQDHPDNPELLLFEIAALDGKDAHPQCQSLANEFIQRFPNSINLDQAHYLLGSSLLESGSEEEAFASLRKAAEITDDPSLKQEIQEAVHAHLESGGEIGIGLGGQRPSTKEEKEAYLKISMRILERALRDYREVHGAYPESLDQLLEGDPPILLRLPFNPFRLSGRFGYTRNGDEYKIDSSPRKNLNNPPRPQPEK